MNIINFETLLVTIFVLVDDWCLTQKTASSNHSPGVPTSMNDSEIITLALMMDYLPFPGETQFLAFIKANYHQWFPHLLTQSQFNRRLRKLACTTEKLRRSWVVKLGCTNEVNFIIDTKPIPVVGYNRNKSKSDFEGSASYGYCATRKMKYFGYKLVIICTLQGVPIAYDLVPANTDERKAVEEVLKVVHGCNIYGDKGFIGQDWQERIRIETGNKILTVARTNQVDNKKEQTKKLIGKIRQRIEGVFHEIQNTGRNPERFLNKTVEGLNTHMAAKIASHTLRVLLRKILGIDVLRFQSTSVI